MLSKLAPFKLTAGVQVDINFVDYNSKIRLKFFRSSPLAQDHLLSLHLCEEQIEPLSSGLVRITLLRFAAVWMAASPREIFCEEAPMPRLDEEDELDLHQIERRLKDFATLHAPDFDDFVLHQQPWDPSRGLGIWASFQLSDPPSYLWTPPSP